MASAARLAVAIGETISMMMFRESRCATTEPVTRAAIESILADESRHLQLGWDALAALGPSEQLQHEATRALAASEQQIAVPALRFLDNGETFDPAAEPRRHPPRAPRRGVLRGGRAARRAAVIAYRHRRRRCVGRAISLESRHGRLGIRTVRQR